MKDPDFEKLKAIRQELSKLGDAGKLTREDFDRLFAVAVEASAGQGEYLDGIETVAEFYGLKPRA